MGPPMGCVQALVSNILGSGQEIAVLHGTFVFLVWPNHCSCLFSIFIFWWVPPIFEKRHGVFTKKNRRCFDVMIVMELCKMRSAKSDTGDAFSSIDKARFLRRALARTGSQTSHIIFTGNCVFFFSPHHQTDTHARPPTCSRAAKAWTRLLGLQQLLNGKKSRTSIFLYSRRITESFDLVIGGQTYVLEQRI